MVARQWKIYSTLFQQYTLRQENQYISQITCPSISRAQIILRSSFSTSNQEITYQKAGKDKPVRFSKSKARFHTVDDTLGITKSKKSNLPIYLGLGLFTILIYLGFIREEPNSSPVTLEELLEKIRISHEENLKNHTVDVKSLNDEGSD